MLNVSNELSESLIKAKTQYMLLPDQAFSATVMLNLSVSFCESIPTAATNGLYIKVNPSFWEGLTPKQRVFLLAHETWHVCFDHMGQRGDRDPQLFNMAGDYVINYLLVHECNMEFIEGGLLDDKYKGLSTYEVYDLIKDDPKHQQQSQCFEGDVEEQAEGESDSQEQKQGMSQEDVSTKIQEIIMQAAMQAEMSGQSSSIPDSIQRRIEEIRNPQLPWNTILLNYFTERTDEDYSWSKRNRRYRDMYLPSLYSEGMGAIRAYFDASGSITQRELDLQCAELSYIKELMNPSRMVLRAFSHYMGKEQCFERDEEISLDCDVRGGTLLQQVIDDIIENDDTEVAIIFTDGEFSYPNTYGIDCDIIWVITNNSSWQCPAGYKVIHMKV